MAEVVLGEQQLAVPAIGRVMLAELLEQEVLQEQLLAQPQRDRHAKRLEATWRECQVGLQQALELQEGLVVEDHAVDVAQADARLLEAVLHGVDREARVVLLAREALFLRRRDDDAILDQRRGAVVVVGRYAEHSHASPCLRTACR
jgi:hypothetical protein